MERKRFPIFAERFNILRDERTQGEFADFLGISRPTVGFYENGTRIPDAYILKQICEKCDVSADWLLGLSDYMTKNQENETDELYSHFTELMVKELDEGDRRRVKRVLLNLFDGLRASNTTGVAYTDYERAAETVGLVMTKVAECLELSDRISSKTISENDKISVCMELCKIVQDASAQAYKELGVFFDKHLKYIRETLDIEMYLGADFGFASDLEDLRKEWEVGHGDHPETQ